MTLNRERIIKKEFSHKYYGRSSIWAENYWNQVQMERARHTVSLLPNSIQSVLEIGCGAGIITKEMMNRFPFVVGLDFAIIPLLQVKNEKIHVIQGDACTLPFPEKAFDAIVAAELLEHLEDMERQQVLFEIARVAKKFILLTVPYKEVLEYNHTKCGDCGWIFHVSYHTKSFNEHEMKSLFNSEFKMITTKTFGPPKKRIPLPIVKLIRIFGGYADIKPGLTICPKCGNAKNYKNVRNWMSTLFLGVLLRFLPLQKFPYWIAALYEKKK